MKVASVNPVNYNIRNNNDPKILNKRQSFGASYDEIIKYLMDSKTPRKMKKALYELTDIPYFTKAVEYTPLPDIKRIAGMKINAQTNILDLALNGNITVGVGENGTMQIVKFIDLPFIAKHNTASKNPKTQINLYQAMQAMPVTVERLEQDATRMYGFSNMFPPFISYRAVACPGETLGKYPVHPPLNEYEKLFRYTTGKLNIDDRDLLVKFGKEVTSPYGAKINYKPTPSILIGPSQSAFTKNIRLALSNGAIEMADKKNLFDLTDIPYFINIAGRTDPLRLGAFAHINRTSDDLFGKMFRKEIPIIIYNTDGGKPQRIPLVDLENLVLEKKRGIINSDDLVQILDDNTFAMKVYKMQNSLKQEIPGVTLKKLDFDSNGEMMITRFHVVNEDGDKVVLEQRRGLDDPDARPMIGTLEYFPRKMFSVLLEEDYSQI